jgi:uncharacterized protein with ParB-like and HNH nuclease domain/predicted transport protein
LVQSLVVYIAAEDNAATVSRWLLIDGQQRMTTVTLLLTALRDRLPKDGESTSGNHHEVPPRAAMNDYYLRNTYAPADRRHKLQLRRSDHEALAALLDERDLPAVRSVRIIENFEFFREKLDEADLDIVYAGLRKLVTVDVCLTRGQDDPQMIFESLNSTGLDLTQADLIRNFVLMRQDEASQTRLYEEYWRPIEIAFGQKYRSDFDKFVRDYLTLQLRPSKQFKADAIYHQFRTYFHAKTAEGASAESILAELKRFGKYYAASSLGLEENAELREAFDRLRSLVGVASVTVLRLYDCYQRSKTLSTSEFAEGVILLESYVFRQSMCGMQPRSFGELFASLAYKIKDESPLQCLKVALKRQSRKRRFPTDGEFRESLETRDIYDARNCFYLLERIENSGKERVLTTKLTIEHIMPQNESLSLEWREMLGPEWKSVQESWLHRLGNLTLTGYNSEYSDRSYTDKKSMKNGFDSSPLRLNRAMRNSAVWTANEMEKRGRELAAQALGIWPGIDVDLNAVKQAELEEHQAQAARYTIEELPFTSDSRALFDLLRPEILSLGGNVIELLGPKSIVYRVFDFFVEVIPRKQRLSLLLNLDIGECDDPTGRAVDASEYSFIINATQSGGVLFSFNSQEDITGAVHLIRQAYEGVSE